MHDIPERHKLYRVSNIAYWTSTSKRYANWEATLEPVNLLPSGDFEVPDENTVLGPNGVRLTKSKVLRVRVRVRVRFRVRFRVRVSTKHSKP